MIFVFFFNPDAFFLILKHTNSQNLMKIEHFATEICRDLLQFQSTPSSAANSAL